MFVTANIGKGEGNNVPLVPREFIEKFHVFLTCAVDGSSIHLHVAVCVPPEINPPMTVGLDVVYLVAMC